MKNLQWEIEVDWHNIIGFIVMVLVGCIVIGGFMVAIFMNTLRWNTTMILKMKTGHKLFGFFMILLSQFSVLSGGLKWAATYPDSKPLVIVHFIVFFLIVIVIEGIYQRFIRKENPFVELSNTISREDFKKRVAGGEQLVILDDLVLDVSRFKLSHPGGKFVLQYNIGRDVSKFFYGGYVLENGTGLKPHAHSNVARCIVNSLAVARLEERAKTFSCRIVN